MGASKVAAPVGKLDIAVGDCVLVNPETQGPEYVGKVTHKSKAGDKVTVMWFYRPEDTVMGRKPWNGADELYRSGHTDQIDLGAITSVCNVMTLRDYLAKPQLEEHDFFWRFTYVPMANGGRFEDEAAATYCTCNTPYNPDLTMIYCSTCRNWFHQSCLILDDEDVAAAEQGFECHACKKQSNTTTEGDPPTTEA